MPKALKILLYIILIPVVLILAAAIIIPIFYKDEIVKVVKEQVNGTLKAKVDFADVDLSLLRSFPDLSVNLIDLSVTNVTPFTGTTLYAAKNTGLTVDIWSALGYTEAIELKSITLDEPRIHVVVLEDGTANYDITQPTTDTTSTAFQVALQRYAINNGSLIYDDRTQGLFASIDGLNHVGSGNFTQDVFDLETSTDIAKLLVDFGGVRYLNNAKLDADLDLVVDLPSANYIIKKGEVVINALPLNVSGTIGMPNATDMALDLAFAAPGSNFKELFSLLPGAYTKDFGSVTANGNFNLKGNVKGVYNEKRYPAFNIDLGITNGSIKYPDLPLGINAVNLDLAVKSSSAQMQDLAINLPKFAFKVGDNPVSGKLGVTSVMTDPNVDAEIKGKMDLADLAKAYPLEGVSELSGLINADVLFKGRQSAFEQQKFSETTVKGAIDLANFNVKTADYPKTTIREMHMNFSPEKVEIPSFSAQLGKSDLTGNAEIDNVLAYIQPEKTMKGKLTLRSKYFDADEWMPAEEAPPTATAGEAAAPPFDRFDFTVDAAINMIKYGTYSMKNNVLKGHATASKLQIDEMKTELNDSDIAISGKMTNLLPYLYENGVLTGDIAVVSRNLDLNQFMTAETAAPTAEPVATEPILIPENINLSVTTRANTVKYTDMELTNVSGKMTVANKTASIEKMTANILGGRMDINGTYDTKDAAAPKFKLGYDLANMDFRKTFEQFNTFQKLAPIGQFITGKFNTSLSLDGLLGDDLMPKLESITAEGFLSTLQAQVQSLPALEKVGNLLKVKELKGFDISNTQNWITIKDGKVELKPVDYVFQGIDMNIKGSHGLTNEMDYQMVAKIPREKIGKTTAGAAANTGLEMLSKEAGKLGVNLDVGEFINVAVGFTGSMSAPKVNVKLLGTEGKSTLKDQATTAVKDKLNEEKDRLQKEAEDRLKAQRDRLNREVEKTRDSIQNYAEQKLRDAADRAKKEAKDKAGEVIGDKAGEIIDEQLGDKAKDKLKDAADKIKLPNPFGKKKKDGGR